MLYGIPFAQDGLREIQLKNPLRVKVKVQKKLEKLKKKLVVFSKNLKKWVEKTLEKKAKNLTSNNLYHLV